MFNVTNMISLRVIAAFLHRDL